MPLGPWLATHTGGVGRALSNRNYRIYQTGNSFSLIGTWVQRIAVGWLAWKLTESGTWLGIVVAAELAPSILLGPVGGAVADRVSRLTVLRVTQSLLCLVAVAMAVLTLSGGMTIWLLALLNLLAGVVVSFGQPARLSLVRSLVKPSDLPAAVATNSILWNLARFIGPAVAGVVIDQAGVGWAFALNAVSYVSFLFVLFQLDLPRLARAGRKSLGMVGDLKEGIAYVARHPGVGPMVLLLIASCFTVRPYLELLPGFADEYFKAGVDGLVMLTAAIGVGAIGAGLVVGGKTSFDGLTKLAVGGVLIQALAAVLFVATDSLWIGLIGAAISGASMTTSGVAMQSLIQNSTDPNVLSRVLSLYGLSFRTGPAVGGLLMGAAADFVGWQAPVLIGAALCLVAWAWIRLRMDQIAESLERAAEEETGQ